MSGKTSSSSKYVPEMILWNALVTLVVRSGIGDYCLGVLFHNLKARETWLAKWEINIER